VTARLVYFVSHPIQYQAPLLRRLAREADLSLLVVFERDFSSRSYRDPGFGVDIEWDVPLRDGYDSRLLKDCDLTRVIAEADAVWAHGWETPALRSVIAQAHAGDRPVLMRGENWSRAMPDGSGPRGWLKRRYLARIFARCQAFLAIGTCNQAYYEAHGVPPNRIFGMPYAVDNDFFASRATSEAAAEVRARHGLSPDRKIVLYAGKLTRRKHPEHLLQAWRQASWRDGERPVLIFVGDGELRPNLEAEAGPDVIFTGFRNQTELPGYYAAADLFVLLAEREPWGLAVNEAMACGTGVVASDEVGAAYDLVDEGTGLRLPAGDVAGLSRAFPGLMGRADALGRAARARIARWDFAADIAGLKSAIAAVT
jgi:glycosyltransferase involved in cell wall biosynthesis